MRNKNKKNLQIADNIKLCPINSFSDDSDIYILLISNIFCGEVCMSKDGNTIYSITAYNFTAGFSEKVKKALYQWIRKNKLDCVDKYYMWSITPVEYIAENLNKKQVIEEALKYAPQHLDPKMFYKIYKNYHDNVEFVCNFYIPALVSNRYDEAYGKLFKMLSKRKEPEIMRQFMLNNLGEHKMLTKALDRWQKLMNKNHRLSEEE